jgi:hypothetical protein
MQVKKENDDIGDDKPKLGRLWAFVLLGILFLCLAVLDISYIIRNFGSASVKGGSYLLHGYVTVLLLGASTACLLGPLLVVVDRVKKVRGGRKSK